MVRDGTTTAHQLHGDDGSSSGGPELGEEHGTETHTVEDGQPGSNLLCQSYERNEIPLTVSHSMSTMGVVSS